MNSGQNHLPADSLWLLKALIIPPNPNSSTWASRTLHTLFFIQAISQEKQWPFIECLLYTRNHSQHFTPICLFFPAIYKVDIKIISILQIRRLRLREENSLIQGHTTGKWQNGNSKTSSLKPLPHTAPLRPSTGLPPWVSTPAGNLALANLTQPTGKHWLHRAYSYIL